jgi:hypothetical protein
MSESERQERDAEREEGQCALHQSDEREDARNHQHDAGTDGELLRR